LRQLTKVYKKLAGQGRLFRLIRFLKRALFRRTKRSFLQKSQCPLPPASLSPFGRGGCGAAFCADVRENDVLRKKMLVLAAKIVHNKQNLKFGRID